MWNDSLRANVARVIYGIWKDEGQPETVAAQDVLEHYRHEIGDITATVLGEVLAIMEDDSGPMPFIRVRMENKGGEMGDLALAKIDPDRLLALAVEYKG